MLTPAIALQGLQLVTRRDTKVVQRLRGHQILDLAIGHALERTEPADERVAYRKIKYLMAAKTLDDLRVPPGNKLELLKGDRKGQHSIRINDQWRICFVWSDGGAENVEIVDYH